MKQTTRVLFYKRLESLNPHPRTELRYTSPFELLVAVLLSAHTTDVSVNRATCALFAVANTPQAILDLGQARLEGYLSGIGLYRNKAKYLIQTCTILLEVHHGQIPHDRTALQALPGVGRKTANVILNTVFGEPTIAVDTHLFRVANRTGLAPGATPRAVEDTLLLVTPPQFKHRAHHWLVLHGRYVCRARHPRCHSCPVYDLCDHPVAPGHNVGLYNRAQHGV